MAIKPLVLVFQELRAPSANIINPTLTGCVVGPHYHVRTYAEHKDQVYAGLYDVSAGTTIASMPSAIPGMKLKADGFKIFLDKARVVMATASSATVNADGVLTKAGATFVTSGVKKGDTVKLVGDSTGYTTVQAVNSETEIQLSTAAVVEAGSLAVTITRKVSGVEMASDEYVVDTTSGSVEISDSASLTVSGASRAIVADPAVDSSDVSLDKAQIYVEYVALNVKYAHIPARIEGNTDAPNLLGITDDRNPLGLGAQVMFANAQAVIHAVGLESEDDDGWLGAIDVINRNGFYAQAVLTDDASIIASFKANNIANEAPEKAKYGVVFGAHRLPTTVTPASGTGDIAVDSLTSQKIVFEDTSADFTNSASPVLPGDILTVDGNEHVIDKVVNANRVKVVVSDAFGATATGKTYTITRALTKTQQAESMAATSRAMKHKRCVMTYGPRCVIGGKEVAGYYMNCVAAGMVVGLPAQAGITNKGVAGVEKVLKTNWDYFTETQLDIIAAGGSLVFVQDDPNSLPYVRHQLTTDPDLLETGELSVVKNNDYLSLFFKGIVKPYLGTWNVTPDLIGALHIALSQGIQFQVNNKVAKIGAPLISANIQTLEISKASPDRVEIYLDTQQPKPLNTVGLHMIL